MGNQYNDKFPIDIYNASTIAGADKLYLDLKEAIRELLRAYTALPSGAKEPSFNQIIDYFEVGTLYSKIFNFMRSIIKHNEIQGVSYNHNTKTVRVGFPNEHIKYLQALNSLTIKINELRLTNKIIQRSDRDVELENETKFAIQELYNLQKINLTKLTDFPDRILFNLESIVNRHLSVEGSHYKLSNDLNLTGQYTYQKFKNVYKALCMQAIILQYINSNGWAVWIFNSNNLSEEISNLLTMNKNIVSQILCDLTFKFNLEDCAYFQPLIQSQDKMILFVPLYVQDWIPSALYIDLSKSLHQDMFGRQQEVLTSNFEKRVEQVFRRILPKSCIQPVKIQGVGQIDRVISCPNKSSMILVQIKHMTTYRNDHIEKGIEQLERDVKMICGYWKPISDLLTGWKGETHPKSIATLLVTNWFLGTSGVAAADVKIMNIEELEELPAFEDIIEFINQINSIRREIEPEDIVTFEQKYHLFGYNFELEICDFANLDSLM